MFLGSPCPPLQMCILELPQAWTLTAGLPQVWIQPHPFIGGGRGFSGIVSATSSSVLIATVS